MEKFALGLSSSVCKAKHKKLQVRFSDWIIKIKIVKIEVENERYRQHIYNKNMTLL